MLLYNIFSILAIKKEKHLSFSFCRRADYLFCCDTGCSRRFFGR